MPSSLFLLPQVCSQALGILKTLWICSQIRSEKKNIVLVNSLKNDGFFPPICIIKLIITITFWPLSHDAECFSHTSADDAHYHYHLTHLQEKWKSQMCGFSLKNL